MRRFVLLVISCLVSLTAMAQGREEKRIELTNGTALTGYVERQQDGSYLVEASTGDVFYFTPDEIKTIKVVSPTVSKVAEERIIAGSRTVFRRKGNLCFTDNGEALTKEDFPNYQGWEDYMRAQGNRRLGKAFKWTGAALFLAGAGLISAGSIDEDNGLVISGSIALNAGMLLLPVGIVFKVIGNVRLNKIAKGFNQHTNYAISMGMQRHGIGFAIDF